MNTKVMSFTNTAVQELESNVVQDLKYTIKFNDSHKEAIKDEIIENIEIKALSLNKKQYAVLKAIHMVLKRIVDIIGGIVGTIMLIPLTAIVYIANKIAKDDGPVFFVQERIGKNGKPFKMYKYRSMVVGADEKLEKYLEENEEAAEEYKKYKKLSNDPRITKVGDFLRKTSLDEFPQLINVFKGDMSLVGPRPYLPREKDDMGYYFNDIVKCKPGITGFWQVNGRNDVTFDDRLGMDITYFQKTNLLLDIKLLVKTGLKVLRKEGAA